MVLSASRAKSARTVQGRRLKCTFGWGLRHSSLSGGLEISGLWLDVSKTQQADRGRTFFVVPAGTLERAIEKARAQSLDGKAMDLIGFIEKNGPGSRPKIQKIVEVAEELVKRLKKEWLNHSMPIWLIGVEVLSSKHLSSEVSHLAPTSRFQMVGDSPHRFAPCQENFKRPSRPLIVRDARLSGCQTHRKSTFHLSGLHPVCQAALTTCICRR